MMLRMLVVGFAVATGVVGHADAGDAATRSGEDTGIYVGIGITRDWFDVDLDERAAARDAGITFDHWGTGIGLVVGYGIGPRFRAELSMEGVPRQAHPDGSDVSEGMMRLSAIVPFVTHGWWRPHLIAGLGVTGVAYKGPGLDERIYVMPQGHVGVGGRLKLDGHRFLQTDVLLTILDVAREYETGADDATRYVGGMGRSYTLRFAFDWDF